MSFFEFDPNAYYAQLHGTYGEEAPVAHPDTETEHQTGSSSADGRHTSAVLQGLRNLGIEHGHRPAHALTSDSAVWHFDAQATQAEAGSSSAAAPSRRRTVLGRAGRALGRVLGASSSGDGANPAPGRRRARDEADPEVQPRPRYLAGSIMQAEETTLPRPDLALYPHPCDDDLDLIGRAHDGLKAGGAKFRTKQTAVRALSEFSAWLGQIERPGMRDRLFTRDLELDAEKFVRLGGNYNAPSALQHLRDIESSTHGTTQITPREVRRDDKIVPDEDRLLLDLAFGGDAPHSHAMPVTKVNTESGYRQALLNFSEQLAAWGQSGLADSDALYSDQMTHLAQQYTNMGLPYGGQLNAALAKLREFDRTGAVTIKRKRNTLGIPEADQRLIERYQTQGNRALEAEAEATGQRIRSRVGQTKYDSYAGRVRSFSAWLKSRKMRSIASRIHSDFDSLIADVDLYDDGTKTSHKNAGAIRGILRQMRTMPSDAPEVTMARIDPNRFVHALHLFRPNVSVADVARSTGADERDLRVFLDEQSDTGLTQAGQAAVNSFDGQLRLAADANIALRVQSRAQMPTHTPSPYNLSPMSPSAFPSFSGLTSHSSAGGLGFDLNTPSEVEGPLQPGQPLPAGAVVPINQALRNLNVNVGYASGSGLNCLIDTVLQLQSNTRRPDNGQTSMPELEAATQMWRNYLSQAGIVAQHGQIDLYDTSAVGANLAHNMQMRIQAIEVVDGQAIAHPVLGQQGPLVHILHTPGHFQPLWPRT